jgi:hypothetical protein
MSSQRAGHASLVFCPWHYTAKIEDKTCKNTVKKEAGAASGEKKAEFTVNLAAELVGGWSSFAFLYSPLRKRLLQLSRCSKAGHHGPQ